ncbi:hypothetical protein DY000_02053435 [Brassica cretica]|uniref:Uncharacterized protein n=1 Tax=Brassica cretica TaxID=69181 RepID=A0ABQ7A473_BRACR|nr:hypothetical protein DY000_02053435 [Brassica cretica]
MEHPPPLPPPPYPFPERLKELKHLAGHLSFLLLQGPFSLQVTVGLTTPPFPYPPLGPPTTPVTGNPFPNPGMPANQDPGKPPSPKPSFPLF